MNAYPEFPIFYNTCLLILRNTLKQYSTLSSREKIKIIRENIDKNILDNYYIVGNISYKIAAAINSKTNLIKLSVDSMIKNLIEHPELTLNEYKNISYYINNAEYILKKNNKNLIYFKIDKKIYQFVIKRTKTGNEMFITTFHKASAKQLAKDISRYIPVKKIALILRTRNIPL